MSKRQTTIWNAEPHTIAKIAILRSYLHVWFSIFSRISHFAGKDLWYIDGFAGPGEYTKYADGSPIAALKAAATALDQAAGTWLAGDIHCLMIEEDPKRFANLKRRLEAQSQHPRVHRHLFEGSFADGVAWIKRQRVNPFAAQNPLFAFIDPFGTKGLSFEVIRDLLSRPACEVLVNFDSDGAARVLKGGEDSNHDENLTSLFGGDVWKTDLSASDDLATLCQKSVALYRRQLNAIPKVHYTFAFEMRAKAATINYHLIFAGQHATGLEKMKEQMKRIDQTGEYSFCDAHIHQRRLFDINDPSVHAEDMLEHFRGSTVTYEKTHHYALTLSRHLNPKAMLAVLEKAGKISVKNARPNRKAGTYPKGSVESITFHGGLLNG